MIETLKGHLKSPSCFPRHSVSHLIPGKEKLHGTDHHPGLTLEYVQPVSKAARLLCTDLQNQNRDSDQSNHTYLILLDREFLLPPATLFSLFNLS